MHENKDERLNFAIAKCRNVADLCEKVYFYEGLFINDVHQNIRFFDPPPSLHIFVRKFLLKKSVVRSMLIARLRHHLQINPHTKNFSTKNIVFLLFKRGHNEGFFRH